MKSILLGLAASVALLGAASSAGATVVVKDFTFFDSSHDPIATGQFSYNSADTGLLTYADLDSFSVKLMGTTFNLSFVDGLTSSQDYVYFGYNATTDTFQPGSVNGYAGHFPGILAGLNDVTPANTGFFFDPLAGQGGDGKFGLYTGKQNSPMSMEVASSFSITPEPATWAMMIIGLAGLGAAARIQRRKASGAWAAAKA